MIFIATLALQAAAVAPVSVAATAEAPLLHDTRGRPVMTIEINGQGPFPMVVDTAAQTSLIAGSLAQQLALAPLGTGIQVNGATGGGQSRLYPIDRMHNALLDARNVALVELPNANVTDARGIIGMERLGRGKLLIDRSTARIATAPSGPAEPGFATIRGQRTGEGFVTVPVTLDGVQAPALIDTGAAVTIANAAAIRLLGWSDTDPRLSDGGEIRGASAGNQKIRTARIAKVLIGKIALSNVPIMIADDGEPTPSLILGNDLLNLFPGYAVDFPRGELQIKLPGSTLKTRAGTR